MTRNYSFNLARIIATLFSHSWKNYVATQEYPWLQHPPEIKRAIGRPRKHPPKIEFKETFIDEPVSLNMEAEDNSSEPNS